MTSPLPLKGKVAIVTGASSGIGEATALALAHAGADVVLAARREERLERLAATIGEQTQARVVIHVTDITKNEQVLGMASAAIEAFGRIDILVNNAGVMLLSRVEKRQVKEWDTMIDVNIKGVLYGIGAVLPHMQEQGSGHIINISSVAGHRTFNSGVVYAATKFAVQAISEGLRQEITASQGIRVTRVNPGIVATELTDHITDEEISAQRDDALKKMRPLQSDDVARAVIYAATQPPHVQVSEILVLPTDQQG